MLKHSKIINTLTLEQRLKLVISSKKFERNSIDEFEFNRILIEKNVFLQRTGYFTYFPSNKSLATSWNLDLVKKAGRFSAIENNAQQGAKVFDLLFDSKESSVTEDCFFNGKFLNSYVSGVKSANGLSCVKLDTTDCNNFENKLAPFNYAIQANPDFVLISSLDDLKFLKKKELHKDGVLFGDAKDFVSAITLIQFGASLIFIDENQFDSAISQALLALETYEKSIVELNNGSIDEAQVNALLQSGKALNEEQLNIACDNIIEILCKIDDAHKNQAFEPNVNFYPKTHKVVFDEIAHDNFAVESSRESIVLLKNNGVLPLVNTSKVAVVGDFVKNPHYFIEYSGRNDIYTDLIFDRINDYEDIDTVGFVHGYLKGEQIDNDLILKANKLMANADTCLVFLCAEKDAETLPDAQIELLRHLNSTGKRVVAVVVANKLIDFSFEQYCSAILFSYDIGQGFSRAVLDLITGKFSPSGKMIETSNQENVENIPNYSVANSKYPFGFGLSYTKFEYSNFTLTHAGVSVTIENVGNISAYEIVQLYVSKNNSKISHSNKQLKGFVKVFIERGEKQRVFIPFDDNTFNVYNEQKACFEIEGGKYSVSIGDSFENQKFISTIKLRRYSTETIFNNRVIEKGDEKEIDKQIYNIAKDADQQRIIKKNVLLSYKQKMGLSLFLLLYFNLLSFLLVFAHFKDFSLFEVDLFTLIIGCGDIVLSLIALITFFVCLSKRKKPTFVAKEYINDTLSNIVDNVGLFHQESIVTYQEEVEPEIEEEIVQTIEEIKPVEVEEEEPVSIVEEVEQVKSVEYQTKSLSEIYQNYSSFIRSKGILVEPFYLRTLFSSLVNSSLIFVNSANKQNLEKLVLATQEFFACEHGIVELSNTYSTAEDLLLTNYGTEKIASDFAYSIKKATENNNLSIFALSDATIDNVINCLGEFISFNDNPSSAKIISLTDSCKFALKKNVVLLVIPSQDNYTEIMPEYLAKASISINLPIRENTESESCDYQPKPISYVEIGDHLYETKKESFLQENSWKMFDELEDLLNVKENFVLGNKFTIFAENYSSVFIDCNGEDYDVLDGLLAYKLLPVLKCLNLYKKENGDNELAMLLEKVLTKDNLDKTLRNVKKVVSVVEQEVKPLQVEVQDETEVQDENEVQQVEDGSQKLDDHETTVKEDK